MNDSIKVLDGFVRLVEAWGHGDTGFIDAPDFEPGIVEAARQSTQGAFRGWDQDRKLLAHLYNNNHATPFEFAGMIIEVKAPIMVFREWHRHRTQFFNEMSARYAPLPFVDYVPSVERLLMTSANNKQAQGVTGKTLSESAAREWLENLDIHYTAAQTLYQEGLELGVPKELARLCLTFGRYSQMRAGASLRNWLAFLTLRMDPMAQYEIRQYAHAVAEIIKDTFPETYKLFIAKKES